MIRIDFIIITILILANIALAKPENLAAKKISCSNKNTVVSFGELKKNYTLYDKNSVSVKVYNCEKIQSGSYQFYTVFFSSEVRDGVEPKKVLTYEVILLDKKDNQLKTVRSETVDQLDQSTDSTNTKFENSIKTGWKYDKDKDLVMLKVNIENKTEKNEPYILVFNKKNQWFEDYFPKSKN